MLVGASGAGKGLTHDVIGPRPFPGSMRPFVVPETAS